MGLLRNTLNHKLSATKVVVNSSCGFGDSESGCNGLDSRRTCRAELYLLAGLSGFTQAN